MCLTCGQRCNATSRILVDEKMADDFAERLLPAVAMYRPGDPLKETTKLGAVDQRSCSRKFEQLASEPGDWLLRGSALRGRRKTRPLCHTRDPTRCAHALTRSALYRWSISRHSPIWMQRRSATTPHPSASPLSVFTRNEATFWQLAEELRAGNLYANLPTTSPPPTLPFGGLGISGNGRPAAAASSGFARTNRRSSSGGRERVRWCSGGKTVAC